MRRVVAVLLFAGALAGCASHQVESPWLVQREQTPPQNCEPLTGDQELVLGVSQEMTNAGRRHAALANLERLPNTLPAVRLSKAKLLRVLGHENEAEMLYTGLLSSCLVADARHGLGQIEAARGNYTQAQEHLRAAASLSPANEAIRNDLGVVYMNQRQLSEARFELLTAMELNENSRRAPQNLLVLLMYQGNWQGARDLVSAKGLSSDDFSRAEQRARAMRGNDLNSLMQPVSTELPPISAPAPAQVAAAAAEPAPARPTVAAPVQELARASDVTPASTPVRTATPMPLAVAARAWGLEEGTSAGDVASPLRDMLQEPSAEARPIVCRTSKTSASRIECLPE